MMRTPTLIKRLIPAMLFLGIVVHWYMLYASASGPGAGYTNAPKESNCTSCHTGTLQKNSKLIILKGGTNSKDSLQTNGFTGDSVYHMSLTFSKSGVKKFGFEITCLDSVSAKAAGTLTITNKTTTQSVTGSFGGNKRAYIEHTSKGTSGSGTITWNFDWKAPKAGAKRVIFYIVVNATNNNSNETGDVIYARQDTFYEAKTSSLKAAFTMSSSSICEGDKVTFKDITTGTGLSRQWTFQNGTPASDTSLNPSVTFSTAGKSTIKLVVSDINGRKDSTTQTLVINARPGKTITAGNTKPICYGDSVQLTASSGSSYKWSNGASTQSIYAKDSGKYYVTVGNSSGCSTMSDTFTLKVLPPPSAPSFSVSKDSVCSGSSLTLTAGSGLSSYIFMDGSTILNKSTSNTYSATLSVGTHSLKVVAANSSGCTTSPSSIHNVVVSALPTVKLSANQGGMYCTGDNVVLTATSGLAKYTFRKNKALLYSGTNNTVSFAASTIGAGDVFGVTAENAAGCSADTTISLTYTPRLVPGFTYTNNKGAVSFMDTTAGSNRREWNFGDNSATDSAKSPNHQYTANGVYKVKLVVYNSAGCSDTFAQSITITLTGIEQPVTILNTKIFPNPVQEQLNITINSVSDQNSELILRDIQGHAVLRQRTRLIAGENNVKLGLGELAPGTYILQLKGRDEIRYFNVIKAQ